MNTTDGTQWVVTQASYLVRIPIWQGNRVLDPAHALRICESLNGDVQKLSMNPFRVIDIEQEEGPPSRYIIDGQHRVSILQEYFKDITAQDFTVMVAMNQAKNEDEVIELFKRLNTVKSIQWKEDPVMVANKYIKSLMAEFNTNPKKPFIRSGATRKPYMSVDKLREALISKKVDQWKMTPEEFVENAIKQNQIKLSTLVIKNPADKDALSMKFALGLDDKFTWI